MIAPGTKKGEIFLGPFSFKIRAFSSMLPKPPIPEPIETPTLVILISLRFNITLFLCYS